MDALTNCYANAEDAWTPPQEVVSVGNSIRVVNNTNIPILLRRHEHIGQIHPVRAVDRSDRAPPPPVDLGTKPSSTPHSSQVHVDPDFILCESDRQLFTDLHCLHDNVFDPMISKYNGASSKIEATVNMGPALPPQRKARLPHYNRDTLVTLQQKFDELEHAGVFAKPEDVHVSVEYLNLSFLVTKPNGGHRLVTSFGEVARYSKPQPSLMPNVDSVLRDIARWKFIIVTDLLQAFYQIPLSKASMKYCGVATLFRGVRVYTRSAMGMPGSETCLEELMCHVLGTLVQEGCVAKLADDLYCGGNTMQELYSNWK